MTTLIVDEETRAKLGNLEERLEICDESGRVIGYFTPAPDPSMYEGVDSPVSVHELRRREHEGGGRQLKEILADLNRQANRR